MQAKEFLLHELDNVERTLHDTLRHDYPPGTSAAFYKECTDRIGRLKAAISAIAPGDVAKIEDYCQLVSLASIQISMIERSHLGEFSYPFAYRLQEIALELCKEPGPLKPLHPIIQILSDGGIASYRIYTESYWPSHLRYQRILHIVFPRTNKFHVLLHAIFGHEIGHAAYATPSLKHELDAKVFIPLFAGTPLENVPKAEHWLTNGARPKEVTKYLTNWNAQRSHDFTFLGRNNRARAMWLQELFCDLFGLMMFGPTFAGAMNTLLGSMNPSGHNFSDTHPPFACRANLIVRALKRLDFLNHGATGDTHLDTALATTAGILEQSPSADPWYELFTDRNVDDAIAGLRSVLSPIPKALYRKPTSDELAHVVDNLCRRVPPCGSRLHASESRPEPFALDFRHVLFGGWVVWLAQGDLSSKTNLDFLLINRLCDRGILQQIAVEKTRP